MAISNWTWSGAGLIFIGIILIIIFIIVYENRVQNFEEVDFWIWLLAIIGIILIIAGSITASSIASSKKAPITPDEVKNKTGQEPVKVNPYLDPDKKDGRSQGDPLDPNHPAVDS